MPHTPGPWHATKTVYRGMQGGKHAFVEVGAANSAFWVARVQTFSDDKGEYAANARLIAAAPDLLDACKRQHEAIDTLFAILIGRDPEFFPTKNAAWQALLAGNAAIKKAEDRS